MKIKSKNGNTKISLQETPKWFYLVMIFIPVLFFFLLEITLRIAEYGLDYTQFKTISSYYPHKLFLNPDLPYKYFYNIKLTPSVLPDGFDKIKKENAFRIFVLGGSSTAGWPYVPNASFSRHLKRRLELLYPENTIEVINLGISAVNSYTIRDLIPAVLDQSPDLILIYAGHNEYYGALGVGSTVSLGSSRFLINTFLWLKNFKTTEFFEDLISEIYLLFSSESEIKGNEENETLMSRMIGESIIPYNSELFKAGITQFEGNLSDVLVMCRKHNVPIILGTLTSNILDQKPFISVSFQGYQPADEVYKEGLNKLTNREIKKADSLLIYAKDLDALRFRAPSEMNVKIKKLAQEFNFPVINIDSLFRSKSKYDIVGYNLIVDHLHPNIKGYELIALEFFIKMNELNILPNGRRENISMLEQDSLLALNFPFTKLDSTLAEMKIIMLTGQYPFVPKGTPNFKMRKYKMTNIVDTLSMKILNRQIKWETAHTILADLYYTNKNYNGFIREMNTIIQERPYFDQPLEYLSQKLVSKGFVNEAFPYLEKLYQIKPSYFTAKWLGQIHLYNKNYIDALNFLREASSYSQADYQTWYNLAGAYYFSDQRDSAKNAIDKSLLLKSDNKKAEDLKNELYNLQ